MQDTKTKKADGAECPKEFRHVGLLGNKPTVRDRFALYLVIRSLKNRRMVPNAFASRKLSPSVICYFNYTVPKPGHKPVLMLLVA
jgi:hypothetical protein